MRQPAWLGIALVITCGMVLADPAVGRREPKARGAKTGQQAKPTQIVSQRPSRITQTPAGNAPGESLLNYVRKRSPNGTVAPLDPSRYDKALEHVRNMPQYSSVTHTAYPSRNAIAQDYGDEDSPLTGVGAWTFVGPDNWPGRTRALAVHPTDATTMWAGSADGGVWKTTNSGGSWVALPHPREDMPSLAVNALAVDPLSADVLYAGTGEGYFAVDAVRGAGVFWTVNGGSSWGRLSPEGELEPKFFYVNDIIVTHSGGSPAHVYAATTTGVWRTTNDGFTWTQSLAATAPGGVTDLVLRPGAGTDYLYAAVGTYSPFASGNRVATTIYRNTNAGGGGAWVPLTLDTQEESARIGRTSLGIEPNHPDVVYAVSSRYNVGDPLHYGLHAVYRSTDAGLTWTKRLNGPSADGLSRLLLTDTRNGRDPACSAPSPTPTPTANCCGVAFMNNSGWYYQALLVEPNTSNPYDVDQDRVWVGGYELFRSTNGAASFQLANFSRTEPYLTFRYAHEDIHGLRLLGDQLLVIGDGGLYRTTNLATGAFTGDKCPVSFQNQLEWEPRNAGIQSSQFYHGAVFPNGLTFWGGTQDNGSLRGADGSVEWDRRRPGDAARVVVDTSGSPTYIYITDPTDSTVYRSTDDGTHWEARGGGIDDPGMYAFEVPLVQSPLTPARLYLGAQRVFRTSNRAQGWSQASTKIDDADGVITAIAISPTNESRAVVGTSKGVVFGTNAADTATGSTVWSRSVSGLRAGHMSSLTWDRAGRIFATYSAFDDEGNAGHVFMSTDNGATWAVRDGSGETRIPDVPVHSLLVHPAYPSELYVATDLGVMSSTDAGVSWMAEYTDFPNVRTNALATNDPQPGGARYLYAFTHGRGAYRVELCHPSQAPTVTPPAPIVAYQTICGSGTSVASTAGKKQVLVWGTEYGNQETALRTFINGGSADDSCDSQPLRLPAQVGGQDITDQTVFGLGTPSQVTVRFENDYGLSTGTSSISVNPHGDLNTDGVVDIFDLVVLAGYIVGNLKQGAAPFLAPLFVADMGPEQNGLFDIFDVVLLSGHIVGNVACVLPEAVPRDDAEGPLDASGTATVTATATTTTVPSQGAFSVDVGINLTDVTMTGCSGGEVACVLGGYEIPLQFDKSVLEYVSTTSSPYGAPCGGSRPAQYSLPTVTGSSLANANGIVVFAEENGADQGAPAGGPYCYFRINLKAKTVLTDRWTNLWFHTISNCAIRGGAPCDYRLVSPALACAPNPDQDPTNINKNEDIIIPVHIYVP